MTDWQATVDVVPVGPVTVTARPAVKLVPVIVSVWAAVLAVGDEGVTLAITGADELGEGVGELGELGELEPPQLAATAAISVTAKFKIVRRIQQRI